MSEDARDRAQRIVASVFGEQVVDPTAPAPTAPAPSVQASTAIDPAILARARSLVAEVFDPPPLEPQPPATPPEPTPAQRLARQLVDEAAAAQQARLVAAEEARAALERDRHAAEEQAAEAARHPEGRARQERELQERERRAEPPSSDPSRPAGEALLFPGEGGPGTEESPLFAAPEVVAPEVALASQPRGTTPAPAGPLTEPEVTARLVSEVLDEASAGPDASPAGPDASPADPDASPADPDPIPADPDPIPARTDPIPSASQPTLRPDLDDWGEKAGGTGRVGRWLLVSLLGAVALAWMFPMLVRAVLELLTL